MVLEPQGFVARIAEDLERAISQGRFPKDGSLPSEKSLAKSYGVSRATVREALRQLAARGVVVQHPGRRSRAAALDEAITLENLGVALHAIGPAHPERLRLLEGYLALKREMAVELLAACCEHASKMDLDPLVDACFILADAAHWEQEGRRRAELEFGLLRLAACGAERPGHFLLIQSLERSFWGMAGKLVPHLDAKATHQWAMCAFHALCGRDAQTVRRELPSLLKACDERLLSSLGLAHEAGDTPGAPSRPVELRSGQRSEPGSAAGEEPSKPVPVLLEMEKPEAEVPEREGAPDFVPTLIGVEKSGAEAFAREKLPSSSAEPPSEDASALGAASPEEFPDPAAMPPGVETSEHLPPAGRELPGSVCAKRSTCQTDACEARSTGGAEPRGVGVDRLSCQAQAP
jgi:GntR family transcriptional regulator, transcriptional repressor for pyruvate dehydrogenase complex